MEDVLDTSLTKSKKKAIEREIDMLLAKIAEDIRETKKINKENDRLKKLIEKSHQQLKTTMERFDSH